MLHNRHGLQHKRPMPWSSTAGAAASRKGREPAPPVRHVPRRDARAFGTRGPSQREQRHCEHLMFDFNARFLDARQQDLSLSHLSQHEAGRQGLAAMRSFLDFQVELDRPDQSQINLVKAALIIALDQHIPQTLERLESVVGMVQRHLKPSYGTADVVRCINSVLYDFYRFSGARERFYHPESASMARVLQYKTGGPTALGILYIAVAERVGLRVAAVSLPSHFLVRPLDLGSETDPVFIDPYNGGALYDIAAVGRLLHDNLHLAPPEEQAATAAARAALRAAIGGGGGGGGRPTAATRAARQQQREDDDDDDDDDDDVVPMYDPTPYSIDGTHMPWFRPYLEPVGKMEILFRLLRNLREVYWVPLIRREVKEEARLTWQAQQALSVLRMMRVAAPHDEEHVVAEALCLAAMERRGEGSELLRGFLGEHPEALEATRTLFSLEGEMAALGRLAAYEKAQRDKAAAEASRQRILRARLAGLKGFNGRDPNAVLNDPAFFSRMYGRLWDDNYWISAMLDHHGSQGGGGEDEDGESAGKGAGKGTQGGGGGKAGPGGKGGAGKGGNSKGGSA